MAEVTEPKQEGKANNEDAKCPFSVGDRVRDLEWIDPKEVWTVTGIHGPDCIVIYSKDENSGGSILTRVNAHRCVKVQ
jgi:hypothetical protein